MKIFDWSLREQRLSRRREKLGERFTSDLTTRKFTTNYLQELNPDLNFASLEYIYQIGWSNGNHNYLQKLIRLIEKGEFSLIPDLNGIEYIKDELGEVPVGDYVKTYIFKIKEGQTFIQLIKDSFDKEGQEKEILFVRTIEQIDIQKINKKKNNLPYLE